MSDRIDNDLELMGADEPNGLWPQLAALASDEPHPRLRQRVLSDLREQAQPKRPWWSVLLPSEPTQWVGMAAAAVLGLAVGLSATQREDRLDQRLAQLESQLDGVNQQLLMSRLTAAAPSERLAAALQAARLEQRDPNVAAALLQRAAIDNVPSVRSAAIGALGAEINQTHTAEQLLNVLTANESPLVQMAIIDLILRHGNAPLKDTLQQRVRQGDLHPALTGYVQDTMGEVET